MTRDRADIMQLTFFLGIASAFDAWAHERKLLSIAMLPLVCACLIMLVSAFSSVGTMVSVSAVLMFVMACVIVETSADTEDKAAIYASFFTSGALILCFGAFQTGSVALMDAPLATIPIVAFFLFGGSALVGLVRLLRHV